MDILTDIPELTNLDELDAVAERVARPIIEKLITLQRAADYLTRQVASSRTALEAEKVLRRQDVEKYVQEAKLLQEERDMLAEQIAEWMPRAKEHQHDPDEPQPVLTFDLDGTIKLQIDKGDGGNYPLTDKYSDPFPGVKKWMDRWKSFGACLHIATAGLYYDGPNGLEVFLARKKMIEAWCARYGLPIDLIIANIPVDAYYDDRMIEIPGDPTLHSKAPPPNWDEIGELAEKEMAHRFLINDEGIWERRDKVRVGKEIEDWPDGDMFHDHPRGYSGPRVDVDIHRTLSSASSSMRVAPPRPNAVDCMRKMYEDGVTLTVSCAGWNPRTHTLPDSIRRLAGIRQWLQKWSVPYDRVAAKDHADMYFNDKGVKFFNWLADLPRIYAKFPSSFIPND